MRDRYLYYSSPQHTTSHKNTEIRGLPDLQRSSKKKEAFMGNLIIGFILGIIPSVAAYLYKVIIKKRRVNKFIQLHYATFINPILSSIKDHLERIPIQASESASFSNKIIQETSDFIYKVEYSIKHEYSMLGGDYAFEFIRIAEFTKAALTKINKKYKSYGFKDTSQLEEGDIMERYFSKEKANYSIELLNDYLKDVKDYMNLKKL